MLQEAQGKGEQEEEGKVESVPAVILFFHWISLERMRSEPLFLQKSNWWCSLKKYTLYTVYLSLAERNVFLNDKSLDLTKLF